MRAVSLWPLTLPTIGEVFVPIVIEIAGSSTVDGGSGRTSSGSARVSPIVMSSKPATATMSPGPALLGREAVERLGLQELGDAHVRVRAVVRTQATVWPFLIVPLKTRSSARRPRNGDASRFVTSACSGASSS